MMTTLSGRRLAALGMTAVLLSGTAASAETVVVGYQQIVGPFVAAIADGRLDAAAKKAGVEIDWRQFSSGGDISTALASGNAVILKPSERDPSVPNMIAALFKEAGLPDGVLKAGYNAVAFTARQRHVDALRDAAAALTGEANADPMRPGADGPAFLANHAGGVLGGMARVGLTRLIENARAATFAANTVACTIAGFAATAPIAWQIALGAGFAGALSTWSTLARELGDLISAGRHRDALRYALRTAVIVAQALNNQKLVLDQINALRSTTSNMIESTSQQLRQQGAEINAKSTESLVEVQKLENAFTNVFATMDAIDSYRSAATDSMAATITSLQTQIKRAEPYMERARKQQLESNENMRGQLPGGPA